MDALPSFVDHTILAIYIGAYLLSTRFTRYTCGIKRFGEVLGIGAVA